jgi:C4-dicarboxylate-specific signal transduction histidine kinase
MSTSENREAAFLSKITAGTTHEIRNVLAIVQESAGLIEDMVSFYEESGKLKADRLKKSVDRINAQVDRGADLMSTLNRFAHSLDRERVSVDLYEEAKHVALMCRRLAKQKGHKLQALQNENDVLVTVNRLYLEMALFVGVECCLEQLPEPGTVVMHIGRIGNAPAVDFAVEDGGATALPAPIEATSWKNLVECLDVIGAEVDTKDVSSRFRIRFPRADAG